MQMFHFATLSHSDDNLYKTAKVLRKIKLFLMSNKTVYVKWIRWRRSFLLAYLDVLGKELSSHQIRRAYIKAGACYGSTVIKRINGHLLS
jgi:hypothetical protein